MSTSTRAANDVRLCGRISSAPEERELPSGDRITTLRVSVARPVEPGVRRASDWVDCVARTARVRRTVARWRAGDVVEVEGALRRRFYRAAGATATRLEVELLAGRLVSRASPRGEGQP